ncbi:MAG: serine/threonine-protein kinase [Thermoanaerobaculia bacterium]
MALCTNCGFDGLEEGRACAVCGEITVSHTTPFSELSTEKRSSPPPSPRGGRGKVPDYADGFVYAERYEIEGFLGRGGMGSVYQVRDLESGATLALKILHAAADDPGGSERFRREIGVLAKISHPSIPSIAGSGLLGDEMYFVAEFVDGKNLRRIVRESGPFAPDEAARVCAAVADALDEAHRHGVIHRDVKPHNVMIASDGTVRLLDFGVARGVGIDMKTITATGMIVGTPEYMSPEQFEGHRVDGRSDIYSLGVVLFELLTGRLPFVADTPVALALAHTRDPAPPPRSIRSEIPAWMNRVVLKCLEKNPADRFPLAADLAAELRKDRSRGQLRRLAGGDYVVDDELGGWALVLASSRARTDWSPPMTLMFEGRPYRLERAELEQEPAPRWIYRFAYCAEGDIYRRVVDYAQVVAEESMREKNSISSKLKKWLG